MGFKTRKKLLTMLLLLIILLSNVAPILSIATNTQVLGNDITLTSIGKVYPYHLRTKAYNGNYVTTSLAGYYDNGTFYPAYCMNKELLGVDSTRDDTVNLMYLLKDNTTYNKVWRVVTAGYPYHSASELGVSDWTHAYQATKMAIYCVLGQSNVNDFYGTDTEGQQIADLIQRLVSIGENGTNTYRTPVSTINKVGNLVLSGNYYIQNYNVSANVQISSFDIIKSNFPNGTIITNTAGTEKNTFANGETFQIRIPKNSVETSDINGRIRADVTSKSFPVFYGKTYNPELQNYAITGDPLTLTSSMSDLNLKGNTANIEITKIDEETRETIKDTLFELSKEDGTIIERKSTGTDGKITFNNLYQGTYILREIESNNNYILSTESIRINALYNNTTEITVTNKHKTGNIKVYKVDKDNNRVVLGNVKFDLFSEEFNRIIGSYSTNVNGELYINNLRTGNYKLIERETNIWYDLAQDTEIIVEWNKTIESTIENELKKGQVRVIKVDKDDNEVKLANVKFNVLDKNNKVLETIKTNDEGEALTSKYAIRDFENLTLQETETLENYKLNNEQQTIKLEENQIKDIVFTNEKKKGQIKVIKVDLDNNEIKLEGVKFNVFDEKGNVVDTLITNKDGEAISERLPIEQKYTIQEVNTLENYVLNEDIQTITLAEDQIKDITFTNEKKKGQIKVIKVDLDNSEIKLEGVKFNVLDEKGNVVDILITNKDGETISKRLPIDQKYSVQEIHTLKNYVLNEDIQTVVLAEDQITNIQFENEKIKGYVEITKVSTNDNKLTGEEKGALLSNAIFDIYNDEDIIVDTININENGKGTSKLLEYGNYYIKEQNSGSDYYLLNTEKYEFQIRENLKIIPVIIENASVDIGLDIDKEGLIQAQKNDEIRYSFNSLKNTSNVSLNNFTWTDNLPYQYIKITKLFTGTYNENLDYLVKYKTNKSEDYIEYGTYNTQKNNYIDFTKVILNEGETITDFKIEFGTVKPEFEVVEKPFIFCKVLDTVTENDKWINYTTLTGNYLEHYLEDSAEWSTISYHKELKIKKLPKTGY